MMNLSYYQGVDSQAYFFWQFRKYRFRKIISYFGSSILDVGCGIGHETEILRDEFGKQVVGVDANEQARKILKEKGIECYASLDEVQKQFDTVYLSHVVEHISPGEIYSFFSKLTSCLTPGGTLVVVAPIGKWFWDQPDHYRMYNRKALLALFRDQNIEELYYTYTGSQNVACNILRPVRRWIFSHEWSLSIFYRLSRLSKRDLVIIGRKPVEN